MRKDFECTAECSDDMAVSPPAAAKPPVITLDVSLYEKYLVESGMTDDQKREFLESLWSIIVGFVDLGFGVHPVQQALESGEPDGSFSPPIQQEEKHHKTTQSLRAQIARSFTGKEES